MSILSLAVPNLPQFVAFKQYLILVLSALCPYFLLMSLQKEDSYQLIRFFVIKELNFIVGCLNFVEISFLR